MSAHSSIKLSALSLFAASAVTLASLAVSGCALNQIAAPTAVGAVQVASITGNAYGGSQGIVGGNVVLWQTYTSTCPSGSTCTGNNAYLAYPGAGNKPSASSVIIAGSISGTGAVTTGLNGAFSLPAYTGTCSAGGFLYLTVTGGSTNGVAPGAGAQVNNNSVQATALGPCSQFAATNTGNANVKVTINEATTVAFAYALGNFTYVDNTGTAGLQGVYVGAPANNSAATGACTGTGSSMTCVAAGLAHGFQNAYNLVDAYHTDGTLPTSARITVPGNANGSVPQAMINFLANVLQYCTNTTGVSAAYATEPQGATDNTNCGTLFSDAAPQICAAGTSCATAAGVVNTPCKAYSCNPIDELTAMIDIAHNPDHSCGATFFGFVSAATAFQPTLSAAPYGCQLAITYTGGFPSTTVNGAITSATASAGGSGYVVGDVLTVSGGTGGTLKVTAIGTGGVISTVSVPGGGSGYSAATGAATTGGSGTGAQFTTTVGSGTSTTPQYLALDANDNVYVVASDLPTPTQAGVGAMSSNGTVLWNNGLSSSITIPKFLATDTVGNVWLSNEATSTASIIQYNQTSGNVVNTLTTSSAPAISANPQGLAVDQFNNVWYDQGGTTSSNLYKIPVTAGVPQTQVPYVTGLAASLNEIMFDENQNVWFSTLGGSATSTPVNLYVLPNANAATPTSAPSYSLTTSPFKYSAYTTGYSWGLSIDGQNNIWLGQANSSIKTMYELQQATTGGVISGNPTVKLTTAATATQPREMQFDGQGQLFYSYYNANGQNYYIYNPTAGTSISNKGTQACYAPASTTTCQVPDAFTTAMQIDSTGTVWTASQGTNLYGQGNGVVTQLVGQAFPVWPQLSYQHYGVVPY